MAAEDYTFFANATNMRRISHIPCHVDAIKINPKTLYKKNHSLMADTLA